MERTAKRNIMRVRMKGKERREQLRPARWLVNGIVAKKRGKVESIK